MKKQLKNYFTFNKKEKNGVLVLLCLIIATLSATAVINWRANSAAIGTDLSTLKPSEPSGELADEETRPGIGSTSIPEQGAVSENGLFLFDPNTLDLDGWVKLGLDEKKAQTIINYRNSGAVFRRKEDLKKAYSVDAGMYARLEPYIKIERLGFPVELNTADSTQLEKLYGIGPIKAQELIAYREKLGGFHSTSQLMDLKGITQAKFEYLVLETSVNEKKIKKLSLNTASDKDLSQHPYIGKALAKAIIGQRNSQGNFNSPIELRQKGLVDEDLYRKLAPYLSVE